MKTVIFIAAVSLNLNLMAQTKTPTFTPAQKTTTAPIVTFDSLAAPTDRTSVAPPVAVTNKFSAEHPGNKSVKWKIKGKYYVVGYADPKTELGHIIVYDKTGKIIQKENEVNNLLYPSAIYQYYTKQFPGEKAFKVWQTETEAGQNYFYIFRGKKTLWFDKEGNYLPANKVKSSDPSSYSGNLK